VSPGSDGERATARAASSAPSGTPLLQVYVSAACRSCLRARELVILLRRLRSGAAVQLIDLDRVPSGIRPAGLVGTPTYVLGGRVRWLGNPSAEELLAAWDEASDRKPAEEAEDHGG
jgi:hypothetical protein